MDRIKASYSDIGQIGANPCVHARVKGEIMQETPDLRASDARTDGDSSANISGFAVQILSTPLIGEPSLNGKVWLTWYGGTHRYAGYDKDAYAAYIEQYDIAPSEPLDKSKWAEEIPLERFERLREKGHALAYTYFAIAMDTHRIKIGKSIDPCRRAANLTSQQWERVRIVATLRGDEFEREYHRAFAPHCIEGEWFCPHPDILAEIDQIKAGAA